MIGDDVLAYYEGGPELDRLDRPTGRLELARTQELLERFLEPGSVILDVGGGTGVYAEWLAGRGHTVTLVEPVPLHVEAARRRAGSPPRLRHPTRRRGQAPGRGRFVQRSAAPRTALPSGRTGRPSSRARGVPTRLPPGRSRPCGGDLPVRTTARHLRRRRFGDSASFAKVQQEVAEGRRVPVERRRGAFPDAYFHRPQELATEVAEAGLLPEGIYGIEGPAWLLSDDELAVHLDDPALRDRILWAARAVEEEDGMLPMSAHLLAVARRP